jgi:hypothetical protein
MVVRYHSLTPEQLWRAFADELSMLEDRFLIGGMDPDAIADTYRASGRETTRLHARAAELRAHARIFEEKPL